MSKGEKASVRQRALTMQRNDGWLERLHVWVPVMSGWEVSQLSVDNDDPSQLYLIA